MAGIALCGEGATGLKVGAMGLVIKLWSAEDLKNVDAALLFEVTKRVSGNLDLAMTTT